MPSSSADDNPASSFLPTRRDAIKAVSVAVTCGLAGGSIPFRRATGTMYSWSATDTWQFFTADEARLVEAISEQIIPADQDAGGKQAGVVGYIDCQLAGPYVRHQKAYRDGLRSLQETCRRQFDKPFDALAWDEQTKILVELEAGRAPKELWKSPTCSEFFNLVLEHSMQGFYGSPEHGGNHDYASFKMLKLAELPQAGQGPRQAAPKRDPSGKP